MKYRPLIKEYGCGCVVVKESPTRFKFDRQCRFIQTTNWRSVCATEAKRIIDEHFEGVDK